MKGRNFYCHGCRATQKFTPNKLTEKHGEKTMRGWRCTYCKRELLVEEQNER